MSLTAVGASFTGVTVMIWLAVAVAVPSVMTYGKLTLPLKLSAGVKVITPAVLTLTVPLVTAIVCAMPGVKVVPLMLCMLGVVPSISLSPVNGVKVMAAPSSAMV